MMSRDLSNWNVVMERNVSECLNILNQWNLEQLELSKEVQDFMLNISSHHHCDPKVLFYTVLAGVGHFAEAISVFNMETKQIKPISVYEILIAPSGVEKSKYINLISNSCSKIDHFLYKQYFKKNRTFGTDNSTQMDQQIFENNKEIKTFVSWVNQFGSVKQVYTTPSLLNMLIYTSVFFLANEGDAIFQESNFYNPSDPTSDVKQTALIDLWDGNRLVKSTISRGTQVIKDRSVSICIATTGRRWPDLLKELSKVQMAGGLHERCTYLYFDVNNETTSALTPVAENEYYSSLYDQLLTSNSSNQQLNYSLVQLFFIIKLFGPRVFIWSRESFAFIQPRLLELKRNQPCQLISDQIVFQTKQQMAIRRRCAEHIVRYACLLQIFNNALLVLQSMEVNTICSSNGAIGENFEIEANNKIVDLFGTALPRDKSYHENGIPICPLEVDIGATKSAVGLVFSLLLPQTICLFNYEFNGNNSLEQTPFTETKKKASKYDKNIVQIEKHIMNLKYKFFHKSCITEHHFRDKRSTVDFVLNDLVTRDLLYEAVDNEPFFVTGRVSNIKTYLKYMPTTNDEKRFGDALSKLYNINYTEYKTTFQCALLLPSKCKLTAYGYAYICKEPYQSIINQKEYSFFSNDNSSNQFVYHTDNSDKHSSMNYSVAQNTDVINDYEQSAHDFHNNNQHLSPKDTINCNQKITKTHSDWTSSTNSKTDYIYLNQPSSSTVEIDSDTDKEQFNLKDYENAVPIEHPENIHDNSPLNRSSSTNTQHDGSETQKSILEDVNDLNTSEAAEPMNTIKDSNNEVTMTNTITFAKDYGKILLLPSILLSKKLISAHFKLPAKVINDALNHLINEKLVESGKYLQCSQRKVQAYLKYIPENIECPKARYLLQKKLLTVDVSIKNYIESCKTIDLTASSSRPSHLLITRLQETPYLQLNIDLSIKHKDSSDNEQNNENGQICDTTNNINVRQRRKVVLENENVNNGSRRKKVKANDENAIQ